MNTTDSLIIGYDFTNGTDDTVLIVGRKTAGEVAEIINAFHGQEAVEIYQRLTEKRESIG